MNLSIGQNFLNKKKFEYIYPPSPLKVDVGTKMHMIDKKWEIYYEIRSIEKRSLIERKFKMLKLDIVYSAHSFAAGLTSILRYNCLGYYYNFFEIKQPY